MLILYIIIVEIFDHIWLGKKELDNSVLDTIKKNAFPYNDVQQYKLWVITKRIQMWNQSILKWMFKKARKLNMEMYNIYRRCVNLKWHVLYIPIHTYYIWLMRIIYVHVYIELLVGFSFSANYSPVVVCSMDKLALMCSSSWFQRSTTNDLSNVNNRVVCKRFVMALTFIVNV